MNGLDARNEVRADDEKNGTPISRRGLLAALAIAAGLGLAGLAYADTDDSHGAGRGGHYYWGDWNNGALYNGNGFGCATHWLEWDAHAGHKLRVAMAVELSSNYSNPLYEWCCMQPFSQCGDTNNLNTHRLWYPRYQDNYIEYYWNGAYWKTETGRFAFDNTFLGAGYGRHDTAMHTFGYPSYGWLERKGATESTRTLRANIYLFNIVVNGYNAFGQRYGADTPFDFNNAGHIACVQKGMNTHDDAGGDLSVKLEKIAIRNRYDLFGAIVSLTNRYSDSDLVVRGDGSGEWSRLCQKKDGAGTTDGNFAVELGNASDEYGDFLHCLKSVRFKGWNSTLYAESGRGIISKGLSADAYPNVDSGFSNAYFEKLWVWHNPQASNFCNFWVTDSLKSEEGYSQIVSNETGLCISLTKSVKSDGADVCLWHSGTRNGTKGVSSVDWKANEVVFVGDVSFKEPSNDSKVIEIGDPSSSCTPIDIYKTLSVEHLTRFILCDSDAGVRSASLDIVGGASQAPWGLSWHMETAANRLVGFPWVAANLMRGFYLKLSSADVSGSICYSILKSVDGGWSETYRDGQWTEFSDETSIWGIKIWLEGDVSDGFDLSIRCCTEKTGWGQRHESFRVDAEHAPEITFAGERLIAFQLEAVPRPVGAIKLLADFSNSLKVQLPDDAAGYVYAQTCLMRNAAYATTDTLHSAAQRYRGTVTSSTPLFIGGIRIVYHADGIDDKSVVFTETAQPGLHTANDDATSAAIKSHCNLNDHFDEDPGMGLTGWFTDRGLTAPYGGSELSAGDELHLYARNRCTLHIEYAKGSLEPEEGAVYVSEPKDDAATVEGALELPDFTGLAESHSLDGIELPAIGDNGTGHMAVYYGERISLAAPADAYRKMEDGTWRHIVCDAYLTDKAGGVVPAEHQDGAGHHALHQVALRRFGRRRQRKEVNIIRDGGADSVPSPRASLSGGARR